jgi:hypothetical protein
MKRQLIIAALLVLLVSCQFLGPQQAKEITSPVSTSPSTATDTPTPTQPKSQPAVTQTAKPTVPTEIEPNDLQADSSQAFGGVELIRWQPQVYAESIDILPINLNGVINPQVIAGLTDQQLAALSQDGFTVLQTQEKQFSDIRDSVSKYYGQPYYLTTDAAYHALHVTFDETLKILEREHLNAQAVQIVHGMLDRVHAYPAQGTALEDDTRLAAAYLAVALRLFEPSFALPKDLEDLIRPQMEQIAAASGRAESALIPNFEDDYGAYRPVGHYAGDPALEAYFRGMTWLGRVSFKITDIEKPNYQPSRTPLILTLALREGENTSYAWKSLNEMLNFVIGPTDDPGPAELSTLMDQIYGADVTFTGLADAAKWQQFLERADELPAPQVNSTFVNTTKALQSSRDWRLLGQRFTFDALIFQT